MIIADKGIGRQGLQHEKGERQAKGEHESQGVWQEKEVASNPSTSAGKGVASNLSDR